jgi:hypothetical protein
MHLEACCGSDLDWMYFIHGLLQGRIGLWSPNFVASATLWLAQQ